ncbi:hypothetical protein PVAND_011733 [Polypedilum vanderplanki]|uniref:Uncharacterized protein n=1 Tax=Polypedilum vanderplanki TaxID=319348 RepID=A0A9J6CJI5_POLVA|nr:hypothetical protein PVAND_011733 [Polypedilum vanderplanki]
MDQQNDVKVTNEKNNNNDKATTLNTTVTTASVLSIANNNHHQPTPPPTIIKKYDLSGPFIKKDRRQISSRFNVNKQTCEIESLPQLKGKY